MSYHQELKKRVLLAFPFVVMLLLFLGFFLLAANEQAAGFLYLGAAGMSFLIWLELYRRWVHKKIVEGEK